MLADIIIPCLNVKQNNLVKVDHSRETKPKEGNENYRLGLLSLFMRDNE